MLHSIQQLPYVRKTTVFPAFYERGNNQATNQSKCVGKIWLEIMCRGNGLAHA